MTRRQALVLVGWLFVLLWSWVNLRPSQLGGPITYTVISGQSMEPALSVGDLALIRDERAYGMGDVVAYRTEYGAIVLHRISRVLDDGRFVMRGDANSWDDPFLPRADELLGRLDGHLPKVGWVVEWLRRPVWVSIFVGVVGALVAHLYLRPEIERAVKEPSA
jgi:signal peptidase